MSLTELQDEIVRLSSQRLVAEDERAQLDVKFRNAQRLISQLEGENEELQHKVDKTESELADLSTSLLSEASQQIEAANKKAAAALKLVNERDDLIASQNIELQALKQMLEESTANASDSDTNSKAEHVPFVFTPGDLPDPQLVLDLDAYSSPVRPLLRSDLQDFGLFGEIYNCDTEQQRFLPRLDSTPAWRKPKFIQRLITEDIDPALRLDNSPHLGWLYCRNFTNAVLDQKLTLAPVSAKEMPWARRPAHPCVFCGEKRSHQLYSRQYCARIPSEDPTYLDLGCVARIRLVCEFIQFLRQLCRSPVPKLQQVLADWEKLNLMREQLFWARTGALFPEDDSHVLHKPSKPAMPLSDVPQTPPRPGNNNDGSYREKIDENRKDELRERHDQEPHQVPTHFSNQPPTIPDRKTAPKFKENYEIRDMEEKMSNANLNESDSEFKSPRGSPEPSPKESPEPSPKESPEPSPKESPEPSPKGSPKGSPRGSPQGSPKGSPKGRKAARGHQK